MEVYKALSKEQKHIAELTKASKYAILHMKETKIKINTSYVAPNMPG
jgi:hypothetical protein